MPGEFKNAPITCQSGFVFDEISSRKSHDYRNLIIVTTSFMKSSVFKNLFLPHGNEKPAFSNSSGLKSVFEELCFRGGFLWTVGLTVEIKLRFQISSV